ncbi:MAG: hypothetical protein ABS79_00435 [Planctomycetes bacterium SCN 63-9]|nr:MAG: hypothetical protein ABS79_00435 [Planctomycetes bacterium SCN 63-9]
MRTIDELAESAAADVFFGADDFGAQPILPILFRVSAYVRNDVAMNTRDALNRQLAATQNSVAAELCNWWLERRNGYALQVMSDWG